MIVTPPSPAQAQRQPAATQTDPSTAVVGPNATPGRTLENVSHDPQAAIPFVSELQRVGVDLVLPSAVFANSFHFVHELQRVGADHVLPLPFLSRTSQTDQSTPTANDAQVADRLNETPGEEASLAAMQLPFMPPPVMPPPVMPPPVMLHPVMPLVTPPVNTPASVTPPFTVATPGRIAGLSTDATLAPNPGLTRAKSKISAPGFTAFAESPFSTATTRATSNQHTQATVTNIDRITNMCALSPEAAAVRERGSTRGTSAPTVDQLAQAVLSPNGDTSATRTTNTHISDTATRAPQALVDMLGDRIDWQLKTGSERAVIRLDPPMQGQLEITISRDAGAIQVHLSATHRDVVKQLQAISDTLRQELNGRQTGDVVVVISHSATTERDADGRGRQSGRSPEQAEPGRALKEAESGQPTTRFALSQFL